MVMKGHQWEGVYINIIRPIPSCCIKLCQIMLGAYYVLDTMCDMARLGCSPWGRKGSDMTERLHFHFHFHALEKEMATRSSVLPWRIPGMGEPGGLPSMGSRRVGYD